MSEDRPAVALDVDGVLNLGLFLSSAERGRLRGDEGWYHGRAGYAHDPYATRIVLNRKWGPMVRSIQEAGADLMWATRWESAANMWISPLLGLPDLPHVGGLSGLRKAWRVTACTEGRHWAWIDDEPEELEAAAGAMSRTPGVSFLPVLTDSKTGLTEEHVERVRNWLGSL